MLLRNTVNNKASACKRTRLNSSCTCSDDEFYEVSHEDLITEVAKAEQEAGKTKKNTRLHQGPEYWHQKFEIEDAPLEGYSLDLGCLTKTC